MAHGSLDVTDRTRLRRKRDRGSHDRADIHAILDEALVCHLGFAVDGRPWVFPTTFGRVGDVLYVHGAAANSGLNALDAGAEVCLTATIIDGLVLARSGFHSSMNYRSVMLFGAAERVDDESEKSLAFDAIVDHVAPGRAADVRPATPQELGATLVLRIPIVEASAKIRAGGVGDEPEDLALPIWAGVVPLELTAAVGEPDEHVPAGVETPAYASNYSRP